MTKLCETIIIEQWYSSIALTAATHTQTHYQTLKETEWSISQLINYVTKGNLFSNPSYVSLRRNDCICECHGGKSYLWDVWRGLKDYSNNSSSLNKNLISLWLQKLMWVPQSRHMVTYRLVILSRAQANCTK